MAKTKSRRLWLQIKFSPNITESRRVILDELLKSIDRGDYNYHKKHPAWRIALGWSNRENDEMKWGEFTEEMTASAQSSEGFEFAIRDYLESQRSLL